MRGASERPGYIQRMARLPGCQLDRQPSCGPHADPVRLLGCCGALECWLTPRSSPARRQSPRLYCGYPRGSAILTPWLGTPRRRSRGCSARWAQAHWSADRTLGENAPIPGQLNLVLVSRLTLAVLARPGRPGDLLGYCPGSLNGLTDSRIRHIACLVTFCPANDDMPQIGLCAMPYQHRHFATSVASRINFTINIVHATVISTPSYLRHHFNCTSADELCGSLRRQTSKLATLRSRVMRR
jgi:hypothetical protein